MHCIKVCRGHGLVVQRCRCPGPHTTIEVACPDAEWHAEAVEALLTTTMDMNAAARSVLYDWEAEGI